MKVYIRFFVLPSYSHSLSLFGSSPNFCIYFVDLFPDTITEHLFQMEVTNQFKIVFLFFLDTQMSNQSFVEKLQLNPFNPAREKTGSVVLPCTFSYLVHFYQTSSQLAMHSRTGVPSIQLLQDIKIQGTVLLCTVTYK